MKIEERPALAITGLESCPVGRARKIAIAAGVSKIKYLPDQYPTIWHLERRRWNGTLEVTRACAGGLEEHLNSLLDTATAELLQVAKQRAEERRAQ